MWSGLPKLGKSYYDFVLFPPNAAIGLLMGRKAEASEEQKILESLDKDLAKNLLDEINKRK